MADGGHPESGRHILLTPPSGRLTRPGPSTRYGWGITGAREPTRQPVPELLELVDQGAGAQARILGQPGDVVDERFEWVFTGGCPALLVQCVHFHAFLIGYQGTQ
ncbi:hypothetical protein ACFVKB_27060 [Rhodococcus sp. NPDC127530]|uniref:hypothetical protein n=1 Tax=unclassified Rhodococcus (in: high G+C Gram-positive bacteria) TaxID=192944 RepID=UPI00363B52AF